MSSVNLFKYQPPVDRTMKVLDKSTFVTKIPLCLVVFPEPKNISVFVKEFKSSILRIPRIPHVIRIGVKSGADDVKNVACDNDLVSKGVLLTDAIHNVAEAEEKLPEDVKKFLQETNAELRSYEYVLDYNFWKAEEILRAVLPEEFLDEIPTGFTMTGNIAHLNLRAEFKPYDSLIGQVILDKNQKIECVVDKVSSIATQFRTFPMKIIAGDRKDLIVEQRESNCTFRFDFSKVYWNSRLHTEHDRLVTKFFQPGEVVCDVFAGVGPFAVPAGKKEVIVLANDLNPESFKYLKENIDLNKVANLVKPFNEDGAKFIKNSYSLLKDWISQQDQIEIPIKRRKHEKSSNMARSKIIPIPSQINHYVMNLPDSAISFLGNFRGVFISDTTKSLAMPWVHVHCFEKYGNDEDLSPEEIEARVHQRILQAMETTADILPISEMQFHLVRKVSPTKPMYCVSFQLPQSIAYEKL